MTNPSLPALSYADMANQRRAERKFRTPDGDYLCLYKGHTYTAAKKSGVPMVTLELKPVEAPTSEILETMVRKNRLLKKKFIFSPKTPWNFEDFVVFLDDLGADLSQVRPQTKDPNLVDLRAILDQAERTPPYIKVSSKDQKPFYDVEILEVQPVFGLKAQQYQAAVAAGQVIEGTPRPPVFVNPAVVASPQATTTPQATETATAAPVTTPQPETATVKKTVEINGKTYEITDQKVDGSGYEDFISAGWTADQIIAVPSYAPFFEEVVKKTTPPPPPAKKETPAPPKNTPAPPEATPIAATAAPPNNPFA